ncbi:MAG: hypothetical protein EPO08_07810 [Rhodospirillaceae bacterium]|nr:MAG: hypothetical protein EPO08_07810 [Rhodospirillaceae bacterium]
MTPIRLRLYLTGRTVSAEGARAALAALETHLINERGIGAVVSEIIDVLEKPETAARDDIFATPTLVRLSPSPSVRLFGDLSSVPRLLTGLGLGPDHQQPPRRDAARTGLPVADLPAKVEDDGPWPIISFDIFSSLAPVLE